MLSLAFIYGVGMSIYGAQWYLKDMAVLEDAVRIGNEHVEMRHRINTWGNVHTILMANLIVVVSIAGFSSGKIKKIEL